MPPPLPLPLLLSIVVLRACVVTVTLVVTLPGSRRWAGDKNKEDDAFRLDKGQCVLLVGAQSRDVPTVKGERIKVIADDLRCNVWGDNMWFVGIFYCEGLAIIGRRINTK